MAPKIRQFTLSRLVGLPRDGILLGGRYARQLLGGAGEEQRLRQELELERARSAALEQTADARTSELEDARHVLQRMWHLGQQITIELNQQRVLERFLDAAVDITHADGGVIGIACDESRIKVVGASGMGTPFLGLQLPIASSVMGGVMRTGEPWVVSDVALNASETHEPTARALEQVGIRGLAVLPIGRRGERIGAVVIGSLQERLFTPVELERLEAMGDLLAVALENAELVETLRQAEWRFRTLFRSAPDAVFTVLQSGRIREANDAVRDVTGYDPLQLVGRIMTEVVIPADRERLQDALDAALAGTPSRVEVTTQCEGTPSHVVSLAMSRLPEADPPSVLLVGRDMTHDREMRVRLMESDRLAAVGELVAGVAHEVNNPLSSISAFAQLLLRDGQLTPAQHESVEVIKSETVRASQVLRDLLAFARRSEPRREPLDLNSVIARTLRLRGYQITSSRVDLEQSLASDLPAVIGDARQLQQVVLNLVTNAIQAMNDLGGGTLSVTTRCESGMVVLEMRDTGRGIATDVRERIFEPFFTTKAEGEGTGLGLSVSYGIVNAHGGTITVNATSPQGTTFLVTLPAAATTQLGEARAAAGTAARRSQLAGIRLLFVDDEEALRESMQSFAALRGFTVLTAGNGAEALEMVTSARVDAIVCDIRMPSMGGLDFLEQLRLKRPGLADRTIFITGDGASGRPLATRQPVLSKPFSLNGLEDALVAVMRGGQFPRYPATARPTERIS